MSDPESNYRAWLSKAENDLLNIENNLQANRVPWDTVCFHAQQVAEKLLKAFLVFRVQAGAPRTHDLVALLARCVEWEKDLAHLEGDCRKLTVYAIGSRYPDDLFEPTREDALDLVDAARRIRDEVLNRLPTRPG
jgi:HEPN domain-containing protein